MSQQILLDNGEDLITLTFRPDEWVEGELFAEFSWMSKFYFRLMTALKDGVAWNWSTITNDRSITISGPNLICHVTSFDHKKVAFTVDMRLTRDRKDTLSLAQRLLNILRTPSFAEEKLRDWFPKGT